MRVEKTRRRPMSSYKTEKASVKDISRTSKKKQLFNDALRYVWHQYTQMKKYSDRGSRMIVKGEENLVEDINGKQYIDAEAGMYTTLIGHGREEIAEAVSAQMKRLEYHSLFEYSHPLATELAKKLAQITPGNLRVSCFGCTGSEAVEIAIKISRQFQSLKGFGRRYKVIARRRSYHGITLGALSATGLTKLREAFEPLVPGFRHIPHPDCYCCEFGKNYPNCNLDCARALERQILFEGPETVAAFIGEPVSVADGCIVPVKEYWPMIREICDKYGVVLIADEVLVGFGRTGKWFASEHWDLNPDIMTVAKAITSGYLPLSAAIISEDIAKPFWETEGHTFQHGGTYSGHPTCCACALANIKIIEQEGLVERAAEVGKYLGEKLKELTEHAMVGHVSGIGLIHGIQLVKDKKTKEVLDKKIVDFIREEAYEQGLTYRYRTNGLNIAPPATLTYEQADKIVEILDLCLTKAGRKFL